MKKLNLKKVFLIGMMSIFSFSAYSIKIITISYSKDCGLIGCGSVKVTREAKEYTRADGTRYDVVERSVNCSGAGIHSCPHSLAFQDNNGNQELVSFDLSNSMNMLNLAVTSINNGNNSGQIFQYYTNTTNGFTFLYDVIWHKSTDELGNEKISIQVAFEQQ